MASGLGRRPRLELRTAPSPTHPIIVEPIQPNAVGQVPPMSAMAQTVPEVTSAPVMSAASPRAADGPATEVVWPLPSQGLERARKIQQALHAAGHDPGPIDGKMGRLTQKAIREFQETHGLSVDGKVGPKTWAKLEPYWRDTTAAVDNE